LAANLFKYPTITPGPGESSISKRILYRTIAAGQREEKRMNAYACKLVALAVGVLGLALATSDAHAQFVCGGSATGADPNNGGGSTAAAGSVACGVGVTAPGETSFAAGVADRGGAVEAAGKRSIAIGVGDVLDTRAKGTESIAIGARALADGDSGIAIGNGSSGTGASNVAIGGFINPGFEHTTVLGVTALANGSNSVFVGEHAGGNDTANNAVVIGQDASAKGDNTTAVGQKAQANFAGSAAFGQGATTTRADQQMFGTPSNTYTMAGLASGESKKVQGTPTYLVTSNSSGDLAAYTAGQLNLASTSDIASLQGQINALGQRDRQLADGIAMAIAMAQPVLLSGQTFGLRLGYGNFDGTSAGAVTAAGVVSRGFAGPTSSIVIDGGIGFASESSTTTGRVGVTFGW
jgi:trimeric autotransporter adhesin